MYDLPELYNCRSHRYSVDMAEVQEFDDPAFLKISHDVTDDFKEIAMTILSLQGLPQQRPTEVSQFPFTGEDRKICMISLITVSKV